MGDDFLIGIIAAITFNQGDSWFNRDGVDFLIHNRFWRAWRQLFNS